MSVYSNDGSARAIQFGSNLGGATPQHFIYATGPYPLAFATNGSERARIDSSGNVGIGTPSPVEKLTVAGGITSTAANAAAGSFNGAVIDYSGGNMRLVPSRSGANAGAIQFFYTTSGGAITQGATLDSSSLNISLQSGYGLKLPATPGNTDSQTLDCYQENPLASTAGNGWTPTLSAAATWGGTQPTVDYARYIRIGSLVFCEVRLSGAALTATYGSTTISQPPVTMNAYAYESAVSVSTGVGSGVGVCTSASVLLPTLGATAVMRLSWFYFTTS
jgi:hypothetical protein